ncbi:MAG: helix-turn-helix transcriptional regulator [Leptolyngbyaceae cyanobacterium CRU_2_3]|nr:helix-turn-helix transcriptional regulator [Leptolyngbyaceae cyanobacterium CRU_2_3]
MKSTISPPKGLTTSTKLPNTLFSPTQEQSGLFKGVIEDLIDGILIVSDQREILYINDSARRALYQLNQNQAQINSIPREIWHICETLIHSRNLFPEQEWLIEFEIFTDSSTALNIRVRWLKLESVENPCLLLIIEDRYQAIKNISIAEAERYGLTPREKEVWLLHRVGLTYKQIASELCITPNTVKSIWAVSTLNRKKNLSNFRWVRFDRASYWARRFLITSASCFSLTGLLKYRLAPASRHFS